VLWGRRGRPGRSVPDASSVRLPGPWQHRDVSANGIRLHVAETGDAGAPLVVLLHGFPEFWWTWRRQLPALAEAGFRAVAVDLRGYGDSDKPPRGYDLWTLAGDVAGLIRALGEPTARIVGHGSEVSGRFYCCAHCARTADASAGFEVRDAVGAYPG